MNSTLERQIAKYADHLEGLTVPVSESEIVSRTLRAAPRIRNGLIAAASAAVVIMVVGAVAILTQFGSQEGPLTTPTPTSPPTTAPIETSTTLLAGARDVFSWSEHDLSEWITEQEMTAVLKDVVSRYAETDLEGEAKFDHEGADMGGDEGQWEMGDWTVHYHNGSHDGRYVGPPSDTDSKLPQGVTFEREWGFGWGHYIFSGPLSDEMISVGLRPPGTSFGYPRGSEIDAHDIVLFPLATWMLQEMGWIDSLEAARTTPTSEPESVPVAGTEQILYGAGDISCPEHWAHNQSLPVGTVVFEAGEGMFTVGVELTAAAADSDYGVEVWEPETCRYGGPLLFEAPAPRVLTTDETGAGRIEFIVDNVNPGRYQLNVNVVHNDWEDTFPNADDTRLWEIGGAGFSLVEVLDVPEEPGSDGSEWSGPWLFRTIPYQPVLRSWVADWVAQDAQRLDLSPAP